MKRFILILTLIVSFPALSQTILPTNTSPVGAGTTAVGWTIITGSCDVSNQDYWAGWAAYPWYEPVDNPPNGHTVWVTGFYTEKVGTTISGLTPGEEYNVSFYMCETRSNAGGAPTVYDGTLGVTIGGITYDFPFTGGTSTDWSLETITFTAVTPSMSMDFAYNPTGPINGNFWNISFGGDIVEPACDTLTTSASATEICIGEELTLTATSETGGTVTWDGGAPNGVPFTPDETGVITYTTTSTSPDDCEYSIDITVHELPDVTATASDTEICDGESVTFTGGGADTYTWDMGVTDGEPFTPPIGTETYTVTGIDDVTTCENTASVDVTVHENPTVTATATPDAICIGESIIFTGEGADIYTWDGGIVDGDPFTPVATGTFTYTVTGEDATTGCTGSATVDITVNDFIDVTATATPSELCIGEEVTLSGSGADTYVWDGGVTDGVPFTPGAPGTYTYTVTGSVDGSGCEGTATVDVEVFDLPEIEATADDETICEGESVTFTGVGGDSYIWDMGVTDGVPFTPGALGTETYTVVGTDLTTGCENTASIDVTVNPLPTVSASTSESEICLGESIVLTGSGADTYDWSGGIGITDGVPYTPVSEGTFTYTVTGTSGGCSSTASVEVTVIECEDVIAAFSYDPIICVGDCIEFTDNSSGTIASYEWDFGPDASPSTSTEANPIACFSAIGVYDITLTITNVNGTTSSTTQSLTVNGSPVVNAKMDTIIDIGGRADLIATSDSEGLYSWSPDYTVDCPDCPVTWASPQDSTTYTVTFTDLNGCKNQASMFVLVNYNPSIGVPSAFSPNGDGNNDILFVKGYDIVGLQFQIYNRYGELVFESDNQDLGWDGTFKNRDEKPWCIYMGRSFYIIRRRKG